MDAVTQVETPAQDSAQVTLRDCPTCGASDASKLPEYSPDNWIVATCTDCDLTYLRNPVAYEALEEDFAWEKTYEEKSAKGGSTRASGTVRKLRAATVGLHRDKHDKFRQWFNDGHVLDVGCGGAEHRVRAPMTPYGIELSRALHAEADASMRAQGGFCAFGAGAEAIWDFDEAMFDGIVMHSYLEHETDVMGVLKGAHRALKNSGAVFIRVPNFGSLNRRVIGPKWCGFRYPDHVNYFTAATLRETARRAGFTMSIVNRMRLAVDDNIHALLRKA